MNRLRAALVRSGRDKFLNDISQNPQQFHDRYRGLVLEFHEGTDNPTDWICHVRLDPQETWLKKFGKVVDAHYETLLWLDKKPDDWTIPEWAQMMQKGEQFEDDDPNEEAFTDWRNAETVFGGEDPADVLIRITPNFESKPIRFTEYVAF
jgi:hypothetical protein